MADPGYRPIPGSDRLRTRPVGADDLVRDLEEADPAATVGREVNGEWLARTVVRGGFVPVRTDVFDRLALDLDPLEQVVYLHLYRLALGDERNFCRVSRRELEARAKLSDRRLGKALSGLVKKGCIKLVHRDRVGTLYRVVLPYEVFGEAEPGEVYVARHGAARSELRSEPRPPRVDRVKKEQPVKIVPHEPLSVGAVAAGFFERVKEGPGRTRAEVVEAILERLEEGRSLAEIAGELERFAKSAPRRTPISELKRYSG